MMKKRLVSLLLVLTLLASAISGCGESPAPDTKAAEKTESGNSTKNAEKQTTATTKKPEEDISNAIEVLREYTLADSIGWYTRHFMIIRNNAEYTTVSVETSSKAYDAGGNILALDNAEFEALGPGCTSVIIEAFETAEKIDHYETIWDISENKSYDSVIGDIAVETVPVGKGVVTFCTNNGEVDAEFVEGYTLFFNGDELIAYDETYFTDHDSVIRPGATEYKQCGEYSGKDYDRTEFYLTGRHSTGISLITHTENLENAIEVEKEYTMNDSIGWYANQFLVIKNTSDKTVSVEISALAYGADDALLGAASSSFEALGPGCESVVSLAFETEGKIENCKAEIFCYEEKYYKSVLQDLNVKTASVSKGIIVDVSNDGTEAAEFVEATVLFIKNGEVIGRDTVYFTDDDSELKPGKTISKQMDAYKDFDSFEIYLSGRR